MLLSPVKTKVLRHGWAKMEMLEEGEMWGSIPSALQLAKGHNVGMMGVF